MKTFRDHYENILPNSWKHGHSVGGKRTKTMTTYKSMMDRCYNPNCKAFVNYGGRGITICDRWKGSFINFLEDMGEKPEGLSIERIDCNKEYSPDNCKWENRLNQNRNQRTRKDNSSGTRGVYFNKQANRWRANISANGKRVHLGDFDNIDEAKNARLDGEKRYWSNDE